VWITTRIALSQSTRNLGDIVAVATAANISRRSGEAFKLWTYLIRCTHSTCNP